MNIKALRTDFPVLLIYNLDPSWPAADVARARLLADQLVCSLRQLGHIFQEIYLEDANLAERLTHFKPEEYILFNWCEELPGVPHSTTRPAVIFEELGFTFTGADASALALSVHKPHVKSLLDQKNIPTPRWKVYTSAQVNGWKHFNAIVKPVYEHCSLGIASKSVVSSIDHLAERIRQVVESFQQPALVEEFIDGREFAVSMIGNDDLHLLPVVEMDFSAIENACERIRTYESKFEPDCLAFNQIKTIIPAELSEGECQNLRTVAYSTYRTAGCRDYARLDLRLRDGVFYVLDVNHNADISADASLLLSAQAAGISYGQLGSCLINLAARRHHRFAKFVGLEVRSLGLPSGCILVRCSDGKREWVPKANTCLEPHMRITAGIAPEASNALERLRYGCDSSSERKKDI